MSSAKKRTQRPTPTLSPDFVTRVLRLFDGEEREALRKSLVQSPYSQYLYERFDARRKELEAMGLIALPESQDFKALMLIWLPGYRAKNPDHRPVRE